MEKQWPRGKMAIKVVSKSRNRPGDDRYFFSGMAVLLLGTVFLGFAKTYYSAGMFRATLPNLVIHIHGAVFSSWILLLIVQTSLVSAGRVDMHRRLGLVGFGLACLMVVLGSMAATDLLRRDGAALGANAKTFYASSLGDMVIFGTLVYFAFRDRFKPASHKRLILIATIALMSAAINRWPFAVIQQSPFLIGIFENPSREVWRSTTHSYFRWWSMICGQHTKFIAPQSGAVCS